MDMPNSLGRQRPFIEPVHVGLVLVEVVLLQPVAVDGLHHALHQRSNLLYEMKFLWSLERSFRKKVALFPQRYPLAGLGRTRSIREFDDQITARFSGFTGADDYYFRAAAARVIERITLPTLVIHAHDDPFIRILPETRAKLEANPNITFIETSHGGHCAFLAPPNGYDGRWAERQIVNFAKAFAAD